MTMLPRLLLTLAAMAVPAGLVAAGAPPPGGTISIAATTGDGEYDAALPAFVEAAAAALTDRGFTVLNDPGHAASTLDLVLSRSDIGTAPRKVAGQGKLSLSAGMVVPFSTGRSDLVPIRRVRLEMSLRRRGAAAIVWHGAAVTVREAGGDVSAAADLSRALLGRYPAQPAGIVGVP